ncbi:MULTISPECIES: DUF4178 domain-containing protein [unclassified Chitinophaga]|uniref:DUF4178 domain-containing protein n=1 Tax=unclassified Chitinophaga TaxID=2619133 RepID=UPI0009D62221|nr:MULTISPECIES: DUF4178 domain-containing protein [unclassified Chitinophaga]OMP77410.1 hypothetical protein BW716_20305 [[Flexibacter] sp. ATCC 35208]WPV67130.1 DUF4178 domain-containing protein [Chitinophaga sp. LS1]
MNNFKCPICSTILSVFDPVRTEVFVCHYCYSTLHKESLAPLAFRLTGKLNEPKYHQLIPLGATGIINGIEYTVITYAERVEVGPDKYCWVEYTLRRNEDNVNIFLSTFNGHWLLLSPTENDGLVYEPPQKYAPTIDVDGVTLKHFHNYHAFYHAVRGEFHFDINFSKNIQCFEYIAPPQLLAVEYTTKTEIDLFFGEYIRPKQVSKGFLNGGRMPRRTGVAAAQPFYINFDWFRSLVGVMIFCVLAFVIQYYYNLDTSRKVVSYMQLKVDDTTMNRPRVSESFVVYKMSNMEVTIRGDVDNNWCATDIDLVNEKDGKEQTVALESSYYHGYSDGESWEEGDKVASAFVCSIPPGTYHLVVTPYKENYGSPVFATVTATWNVYTIWNPFFLSLIMLVICILVQIWNYLFEKKRWE